MTFSVYYCKADTCGGEDSYFVGYMQAPDKETALQSFPQDKAFVYWTVKEVLVRDPKDLISQVTNNPQRYR